MIETTLTTVRPTTYARARLRLGMTGVGVFTVLSCLALATGLPVRWLPDAQADMATSLLALLTVVAGYALLHVPLDLLGGRILPARHGRHTPAASTAFGYGLRGVVIQGLIMVVAALLLMEAARMGGRGTALGTAGLLMLGLLAAQGPLVRLVGGLSLGGPAPRGLVDRVSSLMGRPVSVRVWAGRDEGFTGGWFGLPGLETLVIPDHWLRGLDGEELDAEVVRRASAVATGARLRGVVVALGFNLAGLALASRLPGAGFASAAGLVTTGLGLTVWSFLGLLVLPSLSRPAVFAADAFALGRGVSRGVLSRLMRRLDRWQDDEPARSPTVETIFHPIPSVDARMEALDRPGREAGGAYQAARTMLFLSWAGLGLLSRAVHCNAGRPELWAAHPAD